MKHLEKTLKHLPKPEPQVGNFRADLRRRVLTSPLPVPSYRHQFLWATACVVCLVGILIWFVANPAIPQQVHSHMWHQDNSKPLSVASASPSNAQNQEGMLWDWPTVDADRALVEQWVQHQYGQTAPVVQPVDTGEIFAVRTFRLADGRQILVYTAMPERQEAHAMGF